MKIAVTHPRFDKRQLEVVCYLPGSAAGLLVNGAAQVARRGVYDVRDDFGSVIPISFEKNGLFASTIKLRIGHDDIVLESPLNTAQLVVAGLPLVLMFLGGALGGAIGAAAAALNFALMSSRLPALAKYGGALAITAAAVVGFGGSAARLARGLTKVDAKYLAQVAKTASVGLPKQVDDMTLLSSINADGDTGLRYEYQLTTVSRDAVPPTFSTSIRASLAPRVCADPAMRHVVDAGKTLTHHYIDIDRADVVAVVIGAADCKSCTSSTRMLVDERGFQRGLVDTCVP